MYSGSSGNLPMGSRASEILIVDDDPQIRKLFTIVLSRAGYSVTAVDTSSAAFQVLQNQTVDLIVLDLAMPEPDGFEMLKIAFHLFPDYL